MVGRTQYYAATSIDGFLADDDHGLEWLLQFGFDEFQERYDQFLADIGALVMGARTYEFIVGEPEASWAYADLPCWVLTHRTDLPVLDGADVRFVSGDAEVVHRSAVAAAGARNVWLVGGGDVAAQFAEARLLDDLLLTVMPVVLGSGKPLLPGIALTTPSSLVSSHVYPSGAVELRYELARMGG